MCHGYFLDQHAWEGHPCQEIVDTIKKAAASKGNEAHDTRKNAKAQVKRESAAAAEANRTLEEAEAQEIERKSMKCSSTIANQRGVPALIEQTSGREDVCTLCERRQKKRQ